MIVAEAIIALKELSSGDVHVIAECSDCEFVTFTAGRSDRDWSHLIDDHLAQHQPGRAIDIEVDWEPVAFCSVCEDGIGDVSQENDGLRCKSCGTTWDIDGKFGERSDDDQS